MIGGLLLAGVLLTAAALALGTLPEPARTHRCRTCWEDDEQAAIVSRRPVPAWYPDPATGLRGPA